MVSGTKHYRLVDWATQGYLVVVGLIVLGFHNETVPQWWLLVPAHVAGVALIHGLIVLAASRPANRWLAFLRAFYPILLYTAFYRETEMLNRLFVTGYLDEWFIRLEERWFGFQPSLAFMHHFPQRWVAELFYAAYFSYYFMIAGVGLALFLRNRQQFAHYVTVVSLLFYVCYLTYIFLPVCGPRVFYEEFEAITVTPEIWALGEAHPLPETVLGGVFPQIIFLIYRHLEAVGAAFPSSHVAVAVCTAWFSYRYLPRIRHWHAVAAFLLCVSTVYCRYHYVVDVVAGLLVAALIVPLADRFHWWFEARRASDTEASGVVAGTLPSRS